MNRIFFLDLVFFSHQPTTSPRELYFLFSETNIFSLHFVSVLDWGDFETVNDLDAMVVMHTTFIVKINILTF